MQIKVKGDMPVADVIRALIEKLVEIQDDYAVRYSRGATLYINPINEFGEEVVPHKHGHPVEKLYSKGPYRSAADDYVP